MAKFENRKFIFVISPGALVSFGPWHIDTLDEIIKLRGDKFRLSKPTFKDLLPNPELRLFCFPFGPCFWKRTSKTLLMNSDEK